MVSRGNFIFIHESNNDDQYLPPEIILFNVFDYTSRKRVQQKCCQNHTEYPILGKEYPLPQHPSRPHWEIQILMDRLCVKVYQEFKELEILMEDLGTSFLSLPSIEG